MNPNTDMAYNIDVPADMGYILEETARQNNELLAVCVKDEISWRGQRAYIVGANTPSFRQTYGDLVTSTDKEVEEFEMNTLPQTIIFRMPVEQEALLIEQGKLTSFVENKFKEAYKKSNKSLQFAIINGYDLATGKVLTSYAHKNGSIDQAVKESEQVVTATDNINTDFINLINIVEDFDVTKMFATPKTFTDEYQYKENNKLVTLDSALSVAGVGIEKSQSIAIPTVTDTTLYADASNKLAIAGDFSRVKWGVINLDKQFERITAGNPDGLGDLGQRREIAYRLDIAYAWAITHYKAFSIIEAAVEPAQG